VSGRGDSRLGRVFVGLLLEELLLGVRLLGHDLLEHLVLLAQVVLLLLACNLPRRVLHAVALLADARGGYVGLGWGHTGLRLRAVLKPGGVLLRVFVEGVFTLLLLKVVGASVLLKVLGSCLLFGHKINAHISGCSISKGHYLLFLLFLSLHLPRGGHFTFSFSPCDNSCVNRRIWPLLGFFEGRSLGCQDLLLHQITVRTVMVYVLGLLLLWRRGLHLLHTANM
jgi:hypothetical protein